MSKVEIVACVDEVRINSVIAAADELKAARQALHEAQIQMVTARTRIVRWCVENGLESLLKIDEVQLNRYAADDRRYLRK